MLTRGENMDLVNTVVRTSSERVNEFLTMRYKENSELMGQRMEGYMVSGVAGTISLHFYHCISY